MSRAFSIDEQMRALSKAQLCDRSRRLLGPEVAKLSTDAQVSALVEFYERSPRLYRSCEAPEMPREDYDELLFLLRGLPWDRIARRSVPAARKSAKRNASFVLGGVLGNPRFHGFRDLTVGRKGYNDKIVPAALTKHTTEVMCLWYRLMQVISQIDPALEYTSVQVTRNFSGAPRRDKNGVTYQYTLSLDDFEGGRLLAETDDPRVMLAFDARGRPTRLDGRRVHWVAPHTGGERFSLIMYAVKGTGTPVSDETNAICGPPSPLEPP